MRYKPDKKPSWDLESAKSRPGRRSMTDGGGWHSGRVGPPAVHVMSMEAWMNNRCPKTVSVNVNGSWFSVPVRVMKKSA